MWKSEKKFEKRRLKKTQDPPFGNQGWGTLRVSVVFNGFEKLCSPIESRPRENLLTVGHPPTAGLVRDNARNIKGRPLWSRVLSASSTAPEEERPL